MVEDYYVCVWLEYLNYLRCQTEGNIKIEMSGS